MMNKINIEHFKNLNSDCLRGIEFYKQELGILNTRLEEIAKGNTSREAAEGIEHFQNQFIIHRNQLDELRHSLNANEHEISVQLQKSNVFVDAPTATEHQILFDHYRTEEKIFNDLRHEFNQFAAKWM
jgi:hypothetical protein